MRALVYALVALATSCGGVNPADAHAELDRASPRVGAAVAQPPQAVVLAFSEPLEREGSSLSVQDAAGVVASGPFTLDPANAAVARAPLGRLAPGEYTVRWVAKTEDAETRGRFVFTVAP